MVFNGKGAPKRLENGVKTTKELHWMHVDQKEDEQVSDFIIYELSDLGISHDLAQNPRPSIRISKKYEIIKLTFPKETGVYVQENMNTIVRFIITKNSIITISNDSEDMKLIMNDIYINKKQMRNVTDIFIEIITKLINRSYESLDNIDAVINAVHRNIFNNKDKKANFQKAENMRDNIYHLYMFLMAGTEIFDQIRNEKTSFIKYTNRLENVRSRFSHIRDIVGGQKENLSHIADVYLGMLSANMGKYMYKLTVLGSVLLVPAIITGLYGMNIPLPNAGFWTVVGISAVLSILAGFFMAWWAKK